MKCDNILEFLQQGESITVEFKASFDRNSIESLVAFANTQGGQVLVGVTDKADICGVSLGKETLNEWLGQIKSATSPSIIPDIEAVDIGGKTIVCIHIAEYPVKPVNTRGRYYKRIASANHQLSLNEINDLYMQSLQLSWDSHPVNDASLADISIPKIEVFIEQVNIGGRFHLDPSPLHALEKLKFISGQQPRWAALLLFATNPIRHHIHIGRFKTASMIIDDRQITDTLFEAVEQAMKFMVSHIPVAFAFDGSLQRKERFAYPLSALREVLLNAVVHRDYNNPSDIQIKIFDDRITIFSPGRFYGLSVADIQTDHYPSQLRNKLVAEAFYLTRNIEKYGSGFIRIREALRDYPELAFSVQEIGNGVLVSFIRHADTTPASIDKPEGVNEGVNEGVTRLYQYIAQHPGQRLPELSKQLHIPAKTLERWLKQLKQTHLIHFQGAPKTGGYYQQNSP
ncbi:RNA-binding domain-containing protein [Thiothrix winogradskyi]|uniref:DNA binding domain-containing protein n=1 Tax=Thiothrix winogradskyi TaxID=96472 RepID=A0ABY3T3F3_9GAMM|nr:RNA-binding domain-containing protein [Thiothrix winogradskyi]UJS25797.1 putative DNA binding domain-containing protein [Thiothrix winogradskyi]